MKKDRPQMRNKDQKWMLLTGTTRITQQSLFSAKISQKFCLIQFVHCRTSSILFFMAKLIPRGQAHTWNFGSDISMDHPSIPRLRVIQCLGAAIERRVSEGLKVELCMKNRFGLLSDVTRIIAENSLTITRAEVTTTDDKAVFAFYVDDYLGYPVNPRLIDYVKKEIGQTIVQVKDSYENSFQLSQDSFNWSFKACLKAFLGCFEFS